ncbi:MAG: ribonuclease III [Myxococcales bacterium]|nr:ribonuclease III [Myxococcales bacterium]
MVERTRLDLGYEFRDPSLLQRALTHASYVNESSEPLQSNEVLEYLGDAVLDMLVAEALVACMAEAGEGTLTRLRAMLVAEAGLAQVAQEIGLGEHLRLGRGEEAQGGRERPGLLADALEAVIGAAYTDGGLEAARTVVNRLFGPRLAQAAATAGIDPKSRLQAVVQAHRHLTPSYRLRRAWGPDHDRQFEVECLVGDDVVGTGRGRSKKEATMAAAAAALEKAAPPLDAEPPPRRKEPAGGGKP